MKHQKHNSQFRTWSSLTVVAFACLVATGCANVQPIPLSALVMLEQQQLDTKSIQQGVEPLSGPLTMDIAMARALKYNLDRRAKMMEEALAMGQLDISKFDMLPKVMAQAGYSWRDRMRYTHSSPFPSEEPGTSSSTTTDRIHNTYDLGLTWSLLDVGLGYYGAQQQANRFMIASEKRRKAMHLLMQDVRTAYWRAASAQLLKGDVLKTIS